MYSTLMDSIREFQEQQREFANNSMDVSGASAITTTVSTGTDIGIGIGTNSVSTGGGGGVDRVRDVYAMSVLDEAVRIFESYPMPTPMPIPGCQVPVNGSTRSINNNTNTNGGVNESGTGTGTVLHTGTLKYLYLARAQLHADEGRKQEAADDIFQSMTLSHPAT